MPKSIILGLLRLIDSIKRPSMGLGASSINKISEVWLFSKIGEGGGEILKKMNFTITFRYKIPMFLSLGPFIEKGGGV